MTRKPIFIVAGFIGVIAAGAVAFSGCGATDSYKTDRVEIEGVDCVVVRDAGQIQTTDCNWIGENGGD